MVLNGTRRQHISLTYQSSESNWYTGNMVLWVFQGNERVVWSSLLPIQYKQMPDDEPSILVEAGLAFLMVGCWHLIFVYECTQ